MVSEICVNLVSKCSFMFFIPADTSSFVLCFDRFPLLAPGDTESYSSHADAEQMCQGNSGPRCSQRQPISQSVFRLWYCRSLWWLGMSSFMHQLFSKQWWA